MTRPLVFCDPEIRADADACEHALQTQRACEAGFASEIHGAAITVTTLPSIARERARLDTEKFYRNYGDRHPAACHS